MSDELMGELRELVDIFNQSTELKSKMELSPDNTNLWKESQRRAQNISRPKKQIIADLLARLRNIYFEAIPEAEASIESRISESCRVVIARSARLSSISPSTHLIAPS